MKKPIFRTLFLMILASSLLSGGKDWKKFQVELVGGCLWMNPVDLNLRANMDTKRENFYLDEYYNYQAGQNDLFAYTKLESGRFPRIKTAFPWGIKLKYYVNKHLGFSLGFKYLSRTRTEEVKNLYSFPYAYGEMQFQSVYSPYSLFIRGYMPFMGVNLRVDIHERISAEGFLEGGPIFARCAYTFNNIEEWLSAEGNVLDRTSTWYLDEKGEGTGVSLETGLRIFLHTGRLSPFIEGGYSFQRIKRISGPGISITGSLIEETWEGEWGIKQVDADFDWGNLSYEFPSNSWNQSDRKHRDFSLDLSGFQLRLGISFGF